MTRVRPAAVLLAIAISTGLAFAQSTDEVYSVIQFNFSNPGARSLGMAGAFTARADDATAVYANPAGLTQLSRPELSIEGRGWNFSNEFLASGSLPGAAVSDETDDATYGPSFISGMYPGKSERWIIGVFAHEITNFKTEVVSDGVSLSGGADFVRPISARLDLDIQSVGVSTAGKLYVSTDGARSFSVGVTAMYADFRLDSRTERLDALRGAEPGLPASEDAPTSLYDEIPDDCCQFNNRGDVRYYETQYGTDNDFGYSVGLMWKAPVYSIGAIYRRNPEFSFIANSFERVVLPGYPYPLQRGFAGRVGSVAGAGAWEGVFRVPDVLGVGVSVRPVKNFMFAIDWNQIKYSQLLEQTVDVTGTDGSNPSDPLDSIVSLGTLKRSNNYQLEDGNEYRLGLEYALPLQSGTSWFFRAGAWSDPDHRMRYTGPDAEQTALFQPGDDEIHYSAGVGVRLRTFQLDMAGDFSKNVKSASLSAVFYFGTD